MNSRFKTIYGFTFLGKNHPMFLHLMLGENHTYKYKPTVNRLCCLGANRAQIRSTFDFYVKIRCLLAALQIKQSISRFPYNLLFIQKFSYSIVTARSMEYDKYFTKPQRRYRHEGLAKLLVLQSGRFCAMLTTMCAQYPRAAGLVR